MNPRDASALYLIRALDQAAKTTWFTAKTGRRRTFLSQKDADSYDRGFGDYLYGNAPVMDRGPYSDGQWDAFSMEEDRRELPDVEIDDAGEL